VNIILTYDKKPITTNKERAGNRWERAANTKEWRNAFTWIAKRERVPRMKWINVTAQPFQKRGPLQDTAACNPSVKAAIDGLVDAGIVPDDTGDYVRQITFLPCRRGDDQLVLIITGERGDNA
jgi:crossover junction endodeoxyribonuclease RusA